MDLFEAIERRASIRSFDPVEILESDVLKILDAGRRAASGMNQQPLEFILISAPRVLHPSTESLTIFSIPNAFPVF
jgi:nitroreductase